jgi:hypothetical protein
VIGVAKEETTELIQATGASRKVRPIGDHAEDFCIRITKISAAATGWMDADRRLSAVWTPEGCTWLSTLFRETPQNWAIGFYY